MKEKLGSEKAWLLALVVGVAVGVGVGWFTFPHIFPLMKISSLAAWASAIATFSAAGCALWFGLAEIRAKADERERAVSVYTWLFMPDVALAVPALNEISDLITRIMRSDDQEPFPECDKFLIDELTVSIEVRNINAHIESLVHLPMPLREALARLAGQGPILAYRLKALKQVDRISEQSKKFAKSLSVMVEEMEGSIDSTGWIGRTKLNNKC